LSSKKYLETDDSTDLILVLEAYVQHVTEHIWKENNRLFKMAEARLNNNAKNVDTNLTAIEEKKLKEIGKSRSDYETLADDLEKSISEIN
jgi:hemerythrin-like domain-containing protein